jgi:hypothetical protein
MRKLLGIMILSCGVMGAAQASNDGFLFFKPLPRPPLPIRHDPKPTVAPEIDPASAISAFTLLAGGLVVIRGRRFAKKRD